jgi:hypothetical protein
MSLLKRLVWPRVDEEIAIYQNGKRLVKGRVTHADPQNVLIRRRNKTVVSFDGAELSRGLDDCSLVIKRLGKTPGVQFVAAN